MNLSITGRHLEITSALRDHIKDKTNKANKYSHKIIETNVILGVEKYRHTAEINVQLNGAMLSAKEVTEDMYTSFDRALSKIERQLRKYKDKHTSNIHNIAKANRKMDNNSSEDKDMDWDEEEFPGEIATESMSTVS